MHLRGFSYRFVVASKTRDKCTWIGRDIPNRVPCQNSLGWLTLEGFEAGGVAFGGYLPAH